MNEVVTQLIPVFLHSESEAKNMLGNALLHAIPEVYMSGFAMVTSGSLSHIVAGLLMMTGLTTLIIRGMWKILASTFFHQLLELLSKPIINKHN